MGNVAPLAGAWIEIVISTSFNIAPGVAPLAGAWIEILWVIMFLVVLMVAPLAGAWIEMIPFLRLELSCQVQLH